MTQYKNWLQGVLYWLKNSLFGTVTQKIYTSVYIKYTRVMAQVISSGT